MHESFAYELILEEGDLRTSHRFLLGLGKKRFGPPADHSVSALQAIKDIDRLERLALAVYEVDSWQEFVATS